MRATLPATAVLLLLAGALAFGQSGPPVPTTLEDFFLPGSQPGQSGQLESPDRCDNCHGGYDKAVEPAHNWRGGMMSQAMRDPIFLAALAIANQDAKDAGDLCLRCHTPAGWLEGRSVPTDGSALNQNDKQGVQCDSCHKLVRPTPPLVNPYPNDPAYAAGTWPQDQSYLTGLATVPPAPANGMYVADSANAKRGPFTDAPARHQVLYSPFHRDAAICGTCHDVSNPAFERTAAGTYELGPLGQRAASFDPRTMFPVERTYTEWTLSAYNSPTGVCGTAFGGNKPCVSTCQDCHMRDVTGRGANKRDVPLRTDLPLHDLTGGNTFVPKLLPGLYLTEVDAIALQDGVLRARSMLQRAATLDLEVEQEGGVPVAEVRVTNQTGHKLPSGYPEGRRVWLNLQAFDADGALVYESARYDEGTATLVRDAAARVYEAKLGTADGQPSFHFVLSSRVLKDNRIPPRGFTNAAFAANQAAPVGATYADGQHWDEASYALPAGVVRVTATLYYQTVSREYVEFLRDANTTNFWGSALYDRWAANGRSVPEVMATATWQAAGWEDEEPPSAPTNLQVTSVTMAQAALAWTAAADNIGVTGYRVLRDGAVVGTVTDTIFVDAGLKKGTSYTYAVSALDAAGNVSAPSAPVTATTLTRTPRK